MSNSCRQGLFLSSDLAKCKYCYQTAFDMEVFGDIYIGITPGAFPNGVNWIPIQFFYDSVHTSFNTTTYLPNNNNLIVIQSSQGRTVDEGFYPPNNEYWVATGYSVTSNGQATLYGVQFPGWSACPVTSNGVNYYEVMDRQMGD